MKLAFSTNAFKDYTLVAAIEEIKKIGYGGVEILCDIPHAYPPSFGNDQLERTLKTLSSCNMPISNLNAFTLYAIGDVHHPSWIENDLHDRQARIQHTIDCLRLARKLGAKNISTEPGGPVPAPGDLPAISKLFLSGVMTAAEVAEKEGVKLLIEPEPELLLENSSQFRQFMKSVDSDFVKLNFDIGHFYCVGEDPAELVYELADYIEHFHLADIAPSRVHNHLIPGKGAIDFRKVIDAIDGIGYKGFVTVELYPYRENPSLAAQQAYDYLNSI
ncbi:MAG: sugar phosphate isomerase/epimerase family protein [Nitrososphaera sp.]